METVNSLINTIKARHPLTVCYSVGMASVAVSNEILVTTHTVGKMVIVVFNL